MTVKHNSKPDVACHESGHRGQLWAIEVLKQFRLIFKATQQHSQWVESQYGVTSAQLWAICEISKSTDLKVTDLAKAMSIHHSTTCSLLDKLVKKKLVERRRVSQDQRVVTLVLTNMGASIAEKITVAPQGVLQHAIFELPEDSVKTLATHLKLLVSAMNIHDEEAEMEPINAIPKRQKATKEN
jgi:DNA-binding MarR family transcriptional regulator